MLGVEVTAGNVHDSVAWDGLYDKISKRFVVEFVTMDAGYKTPWIAKKTLEDGKIPILPYTRYTGKRDRYKPWEYTYDPVKDEYICPRGERLRHTTTDRSGKRSYRSTPGTVQKLSLQREMRGEGERAEAADHTYLAGIPGFGGGAEENRARQGDLRNAEGDHRKSLCRCERETCHAIYAPQRLGRSHTMGQAQICCHESEKDGDMELEQLLFPLHSHDF